MPGAVISGDLADLHARPIISARAALIDRRVDVPRQGTAVRYRSLVDLVARWWNGERDQVARRDIWLTSDGHRWAVRARHSADGHEVRQQFTHEYEARAMVDRLIAAAPGRWKDITRLIRKPTTAATGGPAAASADQDDSA